jgi:hypothetical protein
VDYVGATNDWMRDYRPAADGRYPFEPDTLESRKLFARALVRAFGSALAIDPAITFEDLPADDRFFAAANIAVSQGWIERAGSDFLPTEPVTTRVVHRALVLALGLGDLAAGADALHLEDGTKVPTPEGFGALLIGMRLGLRYDHDDETLDVGPDTPLPRSEVAWSLYRAATQPSWVRDSLAGYATMVLPARGNSPPREYEGWDLPQRSSAQMASVGPRVRWKDLQPGDLLFYDGDADGTVDHVDTYIGNGWALDSGGSNGGVTITYVEDNWYQEHFVRARRITA